MTQDSISEYRLAHDYGNQPMEIFDGFEPDHLLLSPRRLGWPEDCPAVDLIAEISTKYRKDSAGERYRLLYEQIPHVVMALNKSSNKVGPVNAYLAVVPQSNGSTDRIIVFSFSEVSPLRYHCYIHKVYVEVSRSN